MRSRSHGPGKPAAKQGDKVVGIDTHVVMITARTTGQETVRYDYSERGEVVRKRVSELDGQGEVRRELVWAYAFSGDGRLMEARTPEGRTISFAYDAFGRRIEKRVARVGQVESVSRYAWRGDVMVLDRTERAREGEAPVVEERSYVTLPESVLPLAQRDGAAGALRYFVHGTNGLPEALIEGDGSVAAGIDPGLYGDVPAEQAGITPLRLPGQYADEGSGISRGRSARSTRSARRPDRTMPYRRARTALSSSRGSGRWLDNPRRTGA
ncbi:RHS repeat domain-containing protein [Sorangium sp. So ce1014]|uniref:RHS repeat domain-containing protein n=1 Tax=Sorangium sp. So ce1014 TaxID=3133326 RepID=UPI003F5D6858